MNTRKTSVLVLLLFSSCLCYSQTIMAKLKASNGQPVHNLNSALNYTTIQAAIDASETLNGHTILVDTGIYNEHVVISKSISLLGANPNDTIIDGGGVGNLMHIIVDNVRIAGFHITKGALGILAENSNNSIIAGNNLYENVDAIIVRYSHNCTVSQNRVGYNSGRGILITNSANFTVSGNRVYGNRMYGLNANASTNGVITRNTAYNNSYDGIGLLFGSTNCAIAKNDINENPSAGILLSESSNNKIYQNNIVSNFVQARGISGNSWNNSIEGNYWSDYFGFDANRDGIGDWPYINDSNGVVDNYPLLGKFSELETYTGHDVNVVSNSTVVDFDFSELGKNGTIRLRVSNATAGQKAGFCRMQIPHVLLREPFNVTVDGFNPVYWNYELYDDGHSRWIYFAYNHSMHEILVRGIAPMAISVLSPVNKAYSTNLIPLTFTTNQPTSWIGYSLDAQTNVTITGNTTLSGLLDGVHNVTVYANDATGTTSHSAITRFTVDIVLPSITIQSPQNKSYSTSNVALSFTINEATSWIGYALDGQANVTATGNVTLASLTDGGHHVEVYASDLAENVGHSGLVYFTVDTMSPVVAILTPENKTYDVASIPLTFKANEPVSLWYYVLDEGSFLTILGNTTLSNLPNGAHNIYVRAIDRAGNAGVSETIYFTTKSSQQGSLNVDPVLIVAIAAVVVAVLLLLAFYSRSRKKSQRV